MSQTARRSLFAFAAAMATLLLAGCPITLVKLDNDWTEAYMARLQAEKGDFLVDMPSLDLKFLEISKQALEAAPKMDSRPEKIGAYRVALLAAWKAGESGQDTFNEIVLRGETECQELEKEKKRRSQPRDCALFEIVPGLRNHERKLRAAVALKDKMPSGGSPAQQGEMEALFKDTATNFKKVDDLRVKYQIPEMPVGFDAYLKDQMRRMYCQVGGLYGEPELVVMQAMLKSYVANMQATITRVLGVPPSQVKCS